MEVRTADDRKAGNLTRRSLDATVFSIGIVAGHARSGAAEQAVEAPPRDAFGRCTNHFGQGHMVRLIEADSLAFDFGPLAPLAFAFIDGAHD